MSSHARLQLRHIAMLPFGPTSGSVPPVLMDSDHDSLGEFCHNRGIGAGTACEIVEYRPVNRYQLVQADTSIGEPCSLHLGRFYPYAAADLDRDGKTELAGDIWFADTSGGVWRKALCTVESPAADSYPRVINWHCLDSHYTGSTEPRYIADLDQDSLLEIVTLWYDSSPTAAIFENIGDNKESLVYCQPPTDPKVFGDFDQNGRMDMVCRCSYSNIAIAECVGDNQYVEVCSLAYPGPGNDLQCDHFAGHDVDQNGRPEFFIAYHHEPGSRLYLSMIEAEAEHEYVWYTLGGVSGSPDNLSTCADLDGDSIEEVIWACNTWVRILKATGPHQFDTACVWQNVLSFFSLCNTADYNRNGYNELYIGGSGQMDVVEVEAIRVVHPTVRGLQFSAGDTCWVRWDTFTPPQCDSVSLFLMTDTVVPEGEWFYQLDTIVTGLSPGDTTYPWIVPDTVLDAAWIVAIAYGPGWQFDCSDHPFSIIPAGVAERPKRVALGPMPEPTIVGDVLWLGPDLGHGPKSPSGFRPCPASLLDITGSKVMDLQPGPNNVHHITPGVYFVRSAVSGTRSAVSVRKVVIQR